MRFAGRGARALDDVTVRIEPGERVAIVGSSGAGKSTLLRALLGAVPAAGAVRIGGRDPYGTAADVRAIRARTGFLRQGNDLVLGVSARLNALMGTAATWGAGDWLRALTGRVPGRHAGRLAELAARHGIEEYLPAQARTLSGGQRQRVALVRALLGSPDLLLADEPTAGLDPVTAAAAMDSLTAPGEAMTVLVTTHDPVVARCFARILALRDGRLVNDGSDFDESMIYGRGAG